MKNSEGHSVEPEASVLEQVVQERSTEHAIFDNMVDNENDFNIALVTMPDDYIIRMHDYYMGLEKRESFMCGEKVTPRLERIQLMVSRLEDIPVVQEHMIPQSSTDEEVDLIAETVALIEERQRVRKMGPVRKLVYNMKKRKQK